MRKTIFIILAVLIMSPLIYHFGGDQEKAKTHVGIALNRMAVLKQGMALSKLKQAFSRWYRQEDGSLFRVSSVYGYDRIEIFSPFMEERKKDMGRLPEYIMTYSDGDDLHSPFPRYLWSSEAGKEMVDVPNTPTLIHRYRRVGSKSALTKDGYFLALPNDSYGISLCRSYNYGKKWEDVIQPLVFDDDTYIDLQSDDDGWLWLLTNTNTGDKDADYNYYGLIKLWVSKDKGSTFTEVTSISGSLHYAPSLSNIVGTGNDKVAYIGHCPSYDSLSVTKFYYKILTQENAYSFDADGYRLDHTMSIAANGNTWALLYATENHDTGYTEPVIVRNGSVVWNGDSLEGVYGYDMECEQIACDGKNFVAVFTSTNNTLGGFSILNSTDDAATFSRQQIIAGGTWAGYPTQSIDIVDGQVFYGCHAINTSGASVFRLFAGGVGSDLEQLYEKTYSPYVCWGVRGDARIMKVEE